MGSIGQSASTSLPALDFKEKLPARSFENYGTAPAFPPLSQLSMETGARWQPQPDTQSRAGRKRSRDEAGINLEDNDALQLAEATSFELGHGSEYGEGMIKNRSNGITIDTEGENQPCAGEAGSLSLPIAPLLMAERPVLRSHKSQRLDLSTAPSATEEGNSWSSYTPSSSPTRQSPINRGPTVDDYTMHLGIGWSKISSDEDMQAAARGWAKYIGNHFQITNPKILLQSNGLASYLVEASEGWFLFSEDLTQGRLVATSLDQTFENLRISPPVFDREEVLVASTEPAKPSTDTSQEDMMDTPHIYAGSMNRRKEYLNNSEMGVDSAGSQSSNRQNLDDRMDMS